MARCGCNNTCSCRLEDGQCTGVTGFGTPIDAYRVNVKISACDSNTLTCEDDGLCAKGVELIGLDTDSINMTVVEGPENVWTISGDVLLQDDGTGPLAGTPGDPPGENLLKLNPGQGINGLYVSCEDIQDCVGAAVQVLAGDCLNYDDANNSLNVVIAPDPTTNGIKCTPNGLQVIPSEDPGNTTILGTDGNIYTPGASIAAEGAGTNCANTTVTGSGTAGDPYVISAELIVDPACPLGNCGPNGLCVTPTPVAVSDLAQNVDLVISGSGQPGDPWLLTQTCVAIPITANTVTNAPCLSVQGDTCNGFNFQLGISPDADQMLECRGNGLFVCQVESAVGAAGTALGVSGPFNGTQNYPARFTQTGNACVNLVNPSTCRAMAVRFLVQGAFGEAQVDGGKLESGFEFSLDGGATFNQSGSVVGPFSVGGVDTGSSYSNTDTGLFVTVPPGGNINACIRGFISGINTVNGRFTSYSINLNLDGRAA